MELIEFKDQKSTPDIIYPYGANLRNNNTPLIIDNGSYQCRVGWSTNDEPLLLFKNLIAKPRKERSKKDTVDLQQTPQLQVGNDILNIEAVRFQLKTQFDRNVVTHFEAQENVFDYIFTHLGVDVENCVPHPILITEAVLNPCSSRQLMSELLFECYNVPSVCYGIDALFAYHHYPTKPPPSDALLISFGYHTIHVIPILNNETIFANTRRLNIGGYHVTSFLYRILQLKYPAHATAITLSRAEELLHAICLVALDYKEELKRWMDVEYYEKNTRKIQLPYTTTVVTTLTLEQQKERKKELARRLIEINARKREERLAEDEERLNHLLQIQEMIELDVDEDEVETAMNEHQIRGLEDLHKNIAQLNMKIEKRRQKILQSNSSEDVVLEDAPPVKQQKLGKSAFESDKALFAQVQNAKKMRQEILTKKAVRKQRKQDMAKRRTAAGQERMRIISQLARKEKGNDDFGLRDEDWDIYKTISRDGGDSDSEAENEKLLELEEIIRSHEPLETDDTNAPAESHQLHIGIERYRAPELIFKPYMQGCPEAGLTEVIAFVLSLFSGDEQTRLAANVVLTGGLANLPGMKERIQGNLVAVRPFQSFSRVVVMEEKCLGAWQGMRRFCEAGEEFERAFFTREDYEEKGGDYFRMHRMSNLYCPTPKGQIVDVDI